MITINSVKIETAISERASCEDYFLVERDYYRFEVDGTSVTIIDGCSKTKEEAIDELSIVIPGHTVAKFEFDDVDFLRKQLWLLRKELLMQVIVPSWLLLEVVKAGLYQRIEARAKLGESFIFVQNARLVTSFQRFGPPEESTIDLSVGHQFLELSYVPNKYVRLSTDSQVRAETCSWSPEWDRFISSCWSSTQEDGLRVHASVPETAQSFLVRSKYLEAI